MSDVIDKLKLRKEEAAIEVAQENEAMAGKRHWPEPWMTFNTKLVAVLDDLRERPRHGRIVGNSFGDKIHRVADGVAQTDANRIVACVNSMAGVPDPEKLMAAVRDLVHYMRLEAVDSRPFPQSCRALLDTLFVTIRAVTKALSEGEDR